MNIYFKKLEKKSYILSQVSFWTTSTAFKYFYSILRFSWKEFLLYGIMHASWNRWEKSFYVMHTLIMLNKMNNFSFRKCVFHPKCFKGVNCNKKPHAQRGFMNSFSTTNVGLPLLHTFFQLFSFHKFHHNQNFSLYKNKEGVVTHMYM